LTSNGDRARIAELRRQARIAQGRAPEPERDGDRLPICWESDAGKILRIPVGPGIAGLLPEEAAKRLKWAPGER